MKSRLKQKIEFLLVGFVALVGVAATAAFWAADAARGAPVLQTNLILGCIMASTLLIAALVSRAVACKVDDLIGGLVKASKAVRDGEWPEPFEIDRFDEIGLVQAAFNEMTESLRASQERVLAIISIDPLTGLANHRVFMEQVEIEASTCADSGKAMSLVLIDLDHFADINSRLGHAAGDEALQEVAQVITELAPEGSTISRFGGDSFGALLPGFDLNGSETFGNAVLASLKLLRPQYQLGASVGCAQFGVSTGKASGLLLSAELAMSRAKQLGQGQVCRFDSVPGADESDDPYQVHRFLEDGTFATIQALATAVDAKDEYTRGHSQRVAEYARDLAIYLGLHADDVEAIYRAGTLHDVGKIGVPDYILKKTTPLDEQETVTMQTHPVLGELIVKKAPQLERLITGVRSHHERWDGGGYPDGLAGEKIPPMARLLAVADTFDAMTSDRPYRAGLSFEIALGEILRAAGTQFEPRLARAFAEMMSRACDNSIAA